MFDTEIIRIVMVLGLLSINTFTDLKSRTIYGSDKFYVVFGIIGFSLLLLDSFNYMIWITLLIVVNLTIMFIAWRIRLMGSGDIMIGLAISVTLPTVLGVDLFPIIVMISASFLSGFFGLSYNSILNILTLYNHESLFSKYKKHIILKFIGFGLAHKKRSWEKHVISIETDDGFALTTSSLNKEFIAKDGQLVTPALPLVPFIIFTFILILSISYLLISLSN